MDVIILVAAMAAVGALLGWLADKIFKGAEKNYSDIVDPLIFLSIFCIQNTGQRFVFFCGRDNNHNFGWHEHLLGA